VVAPILVSSFALASAAGAAPDLEDRCRIAKLNAIAAATSAGLRCHVQALRRGETVDDACLLRDRLSRAFARAERLAPCPPTLGDAQLAVLAFVTAQGASVNPPSPTPTAVPVPTPTPGCGNGVTEPGESCDGGPYCTTSCAFAFPDLCCEFGPVCIAVADIAGADQCFLAGGTPRVGARCVSSDPQCEEGSPCAGACAPTTFPPTEFCCGAGGGCTERTLPDTESLARLLIECGAGGVVQGACVAGSCVPGG
jgi:hypothetical protein